MKETGNTVNGISLIVPTRNEDGIVRNNLELIYKYLVKCDFKNFEILVCDYSIDNTPKIIQELSKIYPEIKYVRVERKGIGAGLRAGMLLANYDMIMAYPIDITWDFKCISDSFLVLNSGIDVAIGSREHKDSISKRPLKRKILSKLYNILLNFLFDLQIKDSQGTCALKRLDLHKFIDKLDSDTPVFQTQILIYAKKAGLKSVEIPVVANDNRKASKVNLIGDGFSMFKELLREFYKLKRILKNINSRNI